MKETSFLFRELSEAKQFYFFLLGKFQTDQLKLDNQMITVQHEQSPTSVELVELIYPFILDHYGTKVSHFILKKHFYFEKEERDQIIPFIVTLGSAPKLIHSQFHYSLYERLVQFVYETSDSIILVDKLYQQLFIQDPNWIELAGYGIEEWKQELFYQEKMDELRSQLNQHPSLYDTVTVLLDENKEPVLLDDHANRIVNEQLPSDEYRFSEMIQDMLKHADIIRKLLLISPKKVIVYTSKNQIHDLYAIMNVFQEKVEVRSLGKFPYVSK